MDQETRKIVNEQGKVASFINSEDWAEVRKKLTDKILDLQNAFSIEIADPQTMFMDLGARKLASQILFDWLKDVEGTKDQFESNKLTLNSKPYIVREE